MWQFDVLRPNRWIYYYACSTFDSVVDRLFALLFVCAYFIRFLRSLNIFSTFLTCFMGAQAKKKRNDIRKDIANINGGLIKYKCTERTEISTFSIHVCNTQKHTNIMAPICIRIFFWHSLAMSWKYLPRNEQKKKQLIRTHNSRFKHMT